MEIVIFAYERLPQNPRAYRVKGRHPQRTHMMVTAIMDAGDMIPIFNKVNNGETHTQTVSDLEAVTLEGPGQRG